MANVCLYVFILHAVGDAVAEILFGRKKKSEIYAKKRRMRAYEQQKKRRAQAVRLRVATPRRSPSAAKFFLLFYGAFGGIMGNGILVKKLRSVVMYITSLFEKNKTVFSFEVFPPKKSSPIESVYGKLEEICALKPDFISVTYGAGGTGGHSRTCEIASKIKNDLGVESVAHLTCVNSAREDIDATLEDFRAHNIQNILALRGDYIQGVEPKRDFRYASELCAYITQKGGFDVAGACYPETHLEAKDEVEDILNLRKKVDAGASHLISQLFFDNKVFYRFLERTRIAGIHVPIEAGIMPVTNKSQIERMVSLCGAGLPAKFSKVMQRYEHKPEALRDAGIAYAVEQIVDLIANGVDGIHLYTMNNPLVARRITEAVSSLL